MSPSGKPPSPRIRARPANGALKLPSMPRFHPANYPLSPNSNSSTPSTGANTSALQTPQPQHPQQRHYLEAQRQLHLYQRELIANARSGRPASSTSVPKPTSPQLAPLGSPGPVTPLMLEEEGGYLVAGAASQTAVMRAQTSGHKELVDKMIEAEKQRLARGGQGERVSPIPSPTLRRA